jgi:hypothetical protein
MQMTVIDYVSRATTQALTIRVELVDNSPSPVLVGLGWAGRTANASTAPMIERDWATVGSPYERTLVLPADALALNIVIDVPDTGASSRVVVNGIARRNIDSDAICVVGVLP